MRRTCNGPNRRQLSVKRGSGEQEHRTACTAHGLESIGDSHERAQGCKDAPWHPSTAVVRQLKARGFEPIDGPASGAGRIAHSVEESLRHEGGASWAHVRRPRNGLKLRVGSCWASMVKGLGFRSELDETCVRL